MERLPPMLEGRIFDHKGFLYRVIVRGSRRSSPSRRYYFCRQREVFLRCSFFDETIADILGARISDLASFEGKIVVDHADETNVTVTIGSRKFSFDTSALMVSKRKNEEARWLRRVKREVAQKQARFVGGNWLCRFGRPIDDARIAKYERFFHGAIQKALPLKRLVEATDDYEDLLNQCRREAFLAILDGLDPEQALLSVSEECREEWRRRNAEDPDAAREKMEKMSVFRRIDDFLWRIKSANHPDKLGGRTVSLYLDGDAYGSNREVVVGSSSGRRDLENLLDVADDADAAKRAFEALSVDRRDQILEILEHRVKPEATLFYGREEAHEPESSEG